MEGRRKFQLLKLQFILLVIIPDNIVLNAFSEKTEGPMPGDVEA